MITIRNISFAQLGIHLLAATLLTLLLGTDASEANSEVNIFQNRSHQDISGKIQYLVDQSDKLTIDEIIALKAENWQKTNSFLPDFGYSNFPHWFQLKINNIDHPKENWVLYNYFSSIDYIDAYFVQNNKIIAYQKGGDRYAFNERAIDYHKPAFPFTLKASQTINVFIKVKTSDSLKFPLFLNSEAKHFIKASSSRMFDGLFFGGMLAVIFCNLFLLLATREKSYFYFVFFASSITLGMADISGYSYQYLWSNSPQLNEKASLIILSLCYMSAALFASDFLNYQQLKLSTQRLFQVMVISPIFLITGNLVFSYENMVMPSLSFSVILILATLYAVGEILLSQNMPRSTTRAAKIFLAIFAASFGAIALYFLDPKMGMLMLISLLSIAFGDKISRARADKLEAEAMAEKLSLENLRLEEANTLDKLTQLKNRKFLDYALEMEYGSARRQKESVSLCLISIDNLNETAKTLGSDAADAYLLETAHLLQTMVQRPRDLIARSSENEFAIVLPMTDLKGARLVSERIREAIETRKVYFNDEVIKLTASVGVSCHEASTLQDQNVLFDQASSALIQTKSSGINKITIFEQTSKSENETSEA